MEHAAHRERSVRDGIDCNHDRFLTCTGRHSGELRARDRSRSGAPMDAKKLCRNEGRFARRKVEGETTNQQDRVELVKRARLPAASNGFQHLPTVTADLPYGFLQAAQSLELEIDRLQFTDKLLLFSDITV